MIEGIPLIEFVNNVGIPGAIVLALIWGAREAAKWVGPRMDGAFDFWKTEVVPRREKQIEAQTEALAKVGEGNTRLSLSLDALREGLDALRTEVRRGNEAITIELRTGNSELKDELRNGHREIKTEISGQAREIAALTMMWKMQQEGKGGHDTGPLDENAVNEYERKHKAGMQPATD